MKRTNVVISTFDVESEAFQAFSELRGATVGDGYEVFEAALMQKKDGNISLLDGFSYAPVDSGATTGIIIGSLVGVLAGPIGVILGAGAGAMAGGAADAGRALDTTSAAAIVASKLFEGETAIAVLVDEEEPAFNAVFDKYAGTTMRYDAKDIGDEVERLYELEAEISNKVYEEMKAERKAQIDAEVQKKIEERAKVDSAINKVVMDLRPI